MGVRFRDSGRPAVGLIASESVGGLPADKTVIPAPGVGKEIVIMGVSSSSSSSLGIGNAGASTFYYATAGSVSFPLGFGVGENEKVSANQAPFLSINYYIRNI